MRVKLILPGLLAALALAVSACGSGSPAGEDGRLQVVTTVAPITCIVANIGGDRVDVTGIVPEGTNSHTFEPRPSRRRGAGRGRRRLRQRAQARGPDEGAGRGERDDGADDRRARRRRRSPERVHLRLLVPEGRTASPTRTCGPTRRWRSATREIVRDDLVEARPGERRLLRGQLRGASPPRSTSSTRPCATSFATIPAAAAQAAHLPRRLRLLRARTTAGRSSARSRSSDFEDPTPKEVADLIDQVRRPRTCRPIFGSEVFPSRRCSSRSARRPASTLRRRPARRRPARRAGRAASTRGSA